MTSEFGRIPSGQIRPTPSEGFLRRAFHAPLALAATCLFFIFTFNFSETSGEEIPLVEPKNAAPTFQKISSILSTRCVVCHGGEKPASGLSLENLDALKRGSRRGPVVVDGRPEQSELIKRIRGTSSPRMPLDGPPYLEDAEISLIEEWVKGGLRDPQAPSDPEASGANPPSKESVSIRRFVVYSDVAPIFKRNCVRCHTLDGIRGSPPEGLRLDQYRNILASGERAAVVPGVPKASELVRRIQGLALPRMPMDGPPFLADEDVELIAKWVEDGSRDDAGKKAEVPVGRRIRLHGTLTNRWQLDDLPILVEPNTRIDKEIRVGSRVRVRGVVNKKGQVVVERIQGR